MLNESLGINLDYEKFNKKRGNTLNSVEKQTDPTMKTIAVMSI